MGGSEPLNLKEQQLDPAVWGKPYSHFLLDIHACPQRHFESMRLHFDLTFCSDRAKSAYSYQCPEQSAVMTCEDWVSQHPEELREAYWSIRNLHVYQWQASKTPLQPIPLLEQRHTVATTTVFTIMDEMPRVTQLPTTKPTITEGHDDLRRAQHAETITHDSEVSTEHSERSSPPSSDTMPRWVVGGLLLQGMLICALGSHVCCLRIKDQNAVDIPSQRPVSAMSPTTP